MTTCTVQGMARVWSGQAPAWPLSSNRSARRGLQGQARLRVTFTRHYSGCARCLRPQSCLRLEGRARTLSGPSPDLSSARDSQAGAARVVQVKLPALGNWRDSSSATRRPIASASLVGSSGSTQPSISTRRVRPVQRTRHSSARTRLRSRQWHASPAMDGR